MARSVLLVVLGFSSSLSIAYAQAPGLDTARIEKLTGVKGTLDPKEGVFRVAVPRTDLSVTAAGVKMTPPLGLTSWPRSSVPVPTSSSWVISCSSRTRSIP
jgi:hypothetical protein